MCIRDRGVSAPGPANGCRRAVRATLAESARCAARGARRTPCLLYTSDAADERSSVDLGGRRIIKKKQHTKNSGSS